MKKKGKIFIFIIQIILIAVIIFSGIKIIEWIKSNKKNKEIMSEIKETDSILTLSTCADNTKYRVVLHAVKVK